MHLASSVVDAPVEPLAARAARTAGCSGPSGEEVRSAVIPEPSEPGLVGHAYRAVA